ncbi:MAG: hypothetical protein UU37_C0004G0011 [Candidatus Gottesmanbacteria bacterium GW2011_GWA2_41_12]|uniref:Fibronectin type-III domain-containing protein n=1 Tax=Candidatus Gottesmanbacteria bacterium GW2011_GWA2_41_12 TaxID=1618440 RepID=A0A0G0UHT0_9BACT|nr:MAG: hypothetical protein UU37_C0004G0011 [Candidatus Gottesmanbacteria bacterium GW2011_GWA2_41_12]
MYRKEQKIPTLIALLFLIFGIGGGIVLVETSKKIESKASPNIIPGEIKITNITESSMSVSWTTSVKTAGTLSYGETANLGFTALDDRDEDGNPKNYETHHVTIRNLKENTKYFFKIISGNKKFDNGGDPYSAFTGGKINGSVQLDPAYGVILNNNEKPAEGSIVYITVGKSLPLSTLVKSSGTWLIPLTNLRNSDLSTRPNIQERERIEILVKGEQNQTINTVTDTKNDSPVPTMTLGKTYDFQNLSVKQKESIAEKKTQKNVLGVTDNVQRAKEDPNYKKIDFVFPYKNGTPILDNKPLFKGLGIPNKEVIIQVNSTPQIGKTTISSDGTWSWSPPKQLEPGDHTVSFTTTDENGTSTTLTRAFYILKSGTQVLGDATDSGNISPSPYPTDVTYSTPTPSITTKPPISASIEPTFWILAVGLVLTLTGIRFIVFPLR